MMERPSVERRSPPVRQRDLRVGPRRKPIHQACCHRCFISLHCSCRTVPRMAPCRKRRHAGTEEYRPMWPNPRIPYQMSSDRPRLAPLNGKPLMVNPVVAIEYWPFDRPMPRGILPAPHGRTERATRCGQLLMGGVRDALWSAAALRCARPTRHQGLGVDERAMRGCLSFSCRARGECRLGLCRPQLVPALVEGSRG